MAYVSPLRAAIVHLVATAGKPWTAELLGLIGSARPDRALAYCRSLVHQGVLHERDGAFQPGHAWDWWLRHPARGHGPQYGRRVVRQQAQSGRRGPRTTLGPWLADEYRRSGMSQYRFQRERGVTRDQLRYWLAKAPA